MIYLKLINAQQAKAMDAYKNIKEKQQSMFIIWDTFIHLRAFLKFRYLKMTSPAHKNYTVSLATVIWQ
jgi:hypothetical protein